MTPLDVTSLLLLAAIWGASFLFQRVASPEFGPIPLVFLRVTMAAALLSAWVVARGGFGVLRTHRRTVGVVGVVNSAIPFSLFAFATLTVSAGLAAVLNGTAALFGAAIGIVWFHERLQVKAYVGLLIGLLGVVFLVYDDLGRGSFRGVLAGLLAAFCYGIAAQISKRTLKGVAPMAVAAGSQLAASAVLAVPALLLWPAQSPSPRAWVSAIALGVVCTGLAYALYFRLIARAGVERTMTVTYLIPIFAALWGGIWLGERVTLLMAIGGLLVLAGVGFTTRGAAPVKPAVAPHPTGQASSAVK